MKKLKYYAPYWIPALVLIALAAAIFSYFRSIVPFSELPRLAAELENEQYFIREDGVILKAKDTNENGTVLTVDTEENATVPLIGSPKAKPISEMRPHEYAALVSDKEIYIRQDGKIFVQHIKYPGIDREYVLAAYRPSTLPDNAEEINLDISRDASFGVLLNAVSMQVPIESEHTDTKCYLSVQLSDGWYIAALGTPEYTSADEYAMLHRNTKVVFPALLEGSYRLEVCIDDKWFYQEMALTRKDTNNYTLNY